MADIPADIIIYALVAAGLVFWLRNILGTRHGDERTRSNTFVTPDEKKSDMPGQNADAMPLEEASEIQEMYNPFEDEALTPSKEVREALRAMAFRDSSFNPKTFLQNAEDAFIIIVEAFAAGNREELEPLLDKNVYAAFDQAITEREEKGHTVINDIQAIRSVTIDDCVTEKGMVYISVKLHVEETSVTKDSEGNVLEGNPNRTSEVVDIWTFGRKQRSRDPVWYLYETREGQIDDHGELPLVPDTHDLDETSKD